MSKPSERIVGASLPRSGQIVRSRSVRAALLKPILNMGRFFVGDTIPRLSDPVEINERVKDLKTRGLPVAPAADSLLAKVLLLIVMRGAPEHAPLREALGLLAGLVLLVVEDDYFYIPETTEHVSNERVEELALKLTAGRQVEVASLARVVAEHQLEVHRTEDLAAIQTRVGTSPEFERVFNRLQIHLGQGQQILENQQDPARRAAHAARFEDACVRTANLLGRLLQVSLKDDHKRLRKRIVSRELKLIEIDALGAANVSDAAQAAEAQRLLDETAGSASADDTSGKSASEIAARLAEIGQSEGDEGEQDEAWFFDME
ncbi:MAG: hypothetical protein JKY65_25670 [Planctomycetes bacterium]|nr:hypothetical protein [Planctomycetota bacterium]